MYLVFINVVLLKLTIVVERKIESHLVESMPSVSICIDLNFFGIKPTYCKTKR